VLQSAPPTGGAVTGYITGGKTLVIRGMDDMTKDTVSGRGCHPGTLADQFATCMKRMERMLPQSMVSEDASPCRHIKDRLLWCIAENRCPDEVDFVRLFCGKGAPVLQTDTQMQNHIGATKKKDPCVIHMERLETCLDGRMSGHIDDHLPRSKESIDGRET